MSDTTTPASGTPTTTPQRGEAVPGVRRVGKRGTFDRRTGRGYGEAEAPASEDA